MRAGCPTVPRTIKTSRLWWMNEAEGRKMRIDKMLKQDHHKSLLNVSQITYILLYTCTIITTSFLLGLR